MDAARRPALWTPRGCGQPDASTALKKQLATLQTRSTRRPGTPEAVKGGPQDAHSTTSSRWRSGSAARSPLGFAGAPLADEPDPLLPRARGLYLAFSSITAAPTAAAPAGASRGRQKQVDEAVGEVNALIEKSVTELNRMLASAAWDGSTAAPIS